MVTGKRPKDLHSLDRSDLGGNTRGIRLGLCPLSERGAATALVDQVRQVTHPDYAPQFLALEFEEMITFSIFMTAGVIYRRNPAAHKRLMLLSAVAISDARRDGSAGQCLGLRRLI
jgi:hypothetical protein